MSKIDNIISIIMVFVTAIGISRAVSLSPATAVFVVVAAFILYELILNAANNSPSIRTMLFVTNGFVFGLSLAVILDFKRGWLSAFVCLLCMGYKYLVAKASDRYRSNSKNFFVILTNAFFYSAMFTVVECMAFSESSLVFIMIYVVSFAFFMCSYVAYKSMEPGKRRYTAYGAEDVMDRDVGSDWKHIIRRTVNYGRQLKDQFDDALDKSGDTFSGLINELRKKVVPEYSDSVDEHGDIRDELDKYRHTITEIASREELSENEIEILDTINRQLDLIYFEYCKDGKGKNLEYETRITKLTGDIEMLRNTISIRKQREAEDKIKEAGQNRRSQAQQARRKREREEREKREQEEKQRREAENEEKWQEDEERREEEERRRREEERKRQEKRRRERNQRTSSAGSKEGRSTKDDSRVAGVETKYFKGCESVDDLSLRYKKLCLIYHPDSGSGDVDTYIELKDEYEMLKKRLS
ncbi:MAG: hypothetical protein IK123_03505 [Lachnospiraceae bacterium]|nr:hypothetical protein [Lachnospiraceae bacterium]